MSTSRVIAVAAAVVAAAGMAAPAQAAKVTAGSSPPRITGNVVFLFTPTAGRCGSTTSFTLDKPAKGQTIYVRWTLYSQYDLPPAVTTVRSGASSWSFTIGHCGVDGAIYTGVQVELLTAGSKAPYDSRRLAFSFQCESVA